MEKKAVEQTGLVPRSILRTFERFRQQLFPGAEFLVLQEFRISRYQVIVSVKCLLTLVLIPLLVSFLTKWFFLDQITEYFWNTQQHEVFLNTYQQNRALLDMRNFEEKIFFESFIEPSNEMNEFEKTKKQNFKSSSIALQTCTASCGKISSSCFSNFAQNSFDLNNLKCHFVQEFRSGLVKTEARTLKGPDVLPDKGSLDYNEVVKFCRSGELSKETSGSLCEWEISVKQKFQQKTLQLAIQYNQETIEALSNLFADFFTFLSLIFLFWFMKPQIIILKSFLTESIYSLSDTTKSFLLILFTDLLVGFHSPRGWEFFLELLLRHFGLPENQDFIFLFVATFPVLLDTVFKYWIFRSLNKISPSTVATYHTMIE